MSTQWLLKLVLVPVPAAWTVPFLLIGWSQKYYILS